jgi:hypothetical protein
MRQSLLQKRHAAKHKELTKAYKSYNPPLKRLRKCEDGLLLWCEKTGDGRQSVAALATLAHDFWYCIEEGGWSGKIGHIIFGGK